MPWWLYALLGAVFAGATNVLIKAGMKGVDSYLATAVRSVLIIPVVWLVAGYLARIPDIGKWSARNWFFLTLSAIASGLSWVCAYKSIDLAGVAKTLPIDKSSIAFAVILAVIFLRERPPWQSIVATFLVLAALGVTLIPDQRQPADLLPPIDTPSTNK